MLLLGACLGWLRNIKVPYCTVKGLSSAIDTNLQVDCGVSFYFNMYEMLGNLMWNKVCANLLYQDILKGVFHTNVKEVMG